jgi:hypothetical protein
MIENRISNKSERNLERNINITAFIEAERKGKGCYVRESQGKEISSEELLKGRNIEE